MNPEISRSLTINQKAAILVAFQWIGAWVGLDISESGEVPRETSERIRLNAELLGLGFENSILKKYDGDDSEEQLFSTLFSIPSNIKPWFVVETYLLLSSPGQITQRAMQITLLYCEKMGISEKEYLEIIKTAYKLTNF